MLAVWMAYAFVVSGLLGLAALASEKALGYSRRPVRWAWIGALSASVMVPALALIAPATLGRAPVIGAVVIPPLEVLTSAVTSTAAPASETSIGIAAVIGQMLLVAWIFSILLFATHLVRAHRRLRREMVDWDSARVLGSSVMVSEERGPAVVGMRRSSIVIPRWILALEDDLLRAIFQHEREHLRAGDHRLLGVGVGLLLLIPWNPIAWWQLSRLRLAIEFDCDSRVLAGDVVWSDYAEALIAVGSRLQQDWAPAAAFADRKHTVEKRLRRITEPVAGHATGRTISASMLAALAIVLVVGAPPPAGVSHDASPGAPATSVRPTFLPYDTPPALENRDEVIRRLGESYPTQLRERGVEGRVEMWLYVNESGEVELTRVKSSSGIEELDETAAEVAQTMSFRPAANNDQPTGVWVSQWLSFVAFPEDR